MITRFGRSASRRRLLPDRRRANNNRLDDFFPLSALSTPPRYGTNGVVTVERRRSRSINTRARYSPLRRSESRFSGKTENGRRTRSDDSSARFGATRPPEISNFSSKRNASGGATLEERKSTRFVAPCGKQPERKIQRSMVTTSSALRRRGTV